MKQTAIWVLLAANLALAGTLLYRGVGANAAHAQVNRGNEPGKYVLVPAESQLGVGLIFVLDTANRRLGAIAPDNQDRLAGMSTISLDPIFDAAENRGSTPPAGNRPGRPNAPR